MFKDNLKNLREHKKISKQEMADLLGVTYMSYSHYENRGSEPPYAVLCKIAQVLDVSIDALLDNDSQPTKVGILNLDRLPYCDSMVFTPSYQFSNYDTERSKYANLDRQIEENLGFVEYAHNMALEQAKKTYSDVFSKHIQQAFLILPLLKEMEYNPQVKKAANIDLPLDENIKIYAPLVAPYYLQRTPKEKTLVELAKATADDPKESE